VNEKRILSGIVLSGVLFLLSSCFSSGKVVETTFDSSRPESASSKVLFWLDITTYNGIDIHKAWGVEKNIPLVTIPPGEAAFSFNAYFSRDYGRVVERYTISDCLFKYNFESGKEYTVRRYLEKKPKKFLQPQEYNYYVRIYGKLPRDRKGKNTKDLKDSDILASILIFDTEDFKN